MWLYFVSLPSLLNLPCDGIRRRPHPPMNHSSPDRLTNECCHQNVHWWNLWLMSCTGYQTNAMSAAIHLLTLLIAAEVITVIHSLSKYLSSMFVYIPVWRAFGWFVVASVCVVVDNCPVRTCRARTGLMSRNSLCRCSYCHPLLADSCCVESWWSNRSATNCAGWNFASLACFHGNMEIYWMATHSTAIEFFHRILLSHMRVLTSA